MPNTSMQELIDKLNIIITNNYDSYTQTAIDIAIELLEKEKLQIKKSYLDGAEDALKNIRLDCDEYFFSNYNN